MSRIRKVALIDDINNRELELTTNSNVPVEVQNTSGDSINVATEETLNALINFISVLTNIIKNPNWLSIPNNALQVITMANSVITTVSTVTTVTTVTAVTGLTNIGGLSADQMVINDSKQAWIATNRSLYT